MTSSNPEPLTETRILFHPQSFQIITIDEGTSESAIDCLPFTNNSGNELINEIPNAQQINIAFDNTAVSGSDHQTPSETGNITYILDQETGELRLIELGNATAVNIGGEEVEVLAVNTDNFQLTSGEPLENSGHDNNCAETETSSSHNRGKASAATLSSRPETVRMKSAPALLRNSRRALTKQEHKYPGATLNATQSEAHTSTKPLMRSKLLKIDNRSCLFHGQDAQASVLPKSPTKSGSTTTPQVPLAIERVVPQSSGVSNNEGEETPQQTYIIFENVNGEQVIEAVGGNSIRCVWGSRNEVIYKIENPTEFRASSSKKQVKSRGVAPKIKQTKKSPPVKKEKPVTSKKCAKELKCMEPDCSVTACNVLELRKHLTMHHDMHFDSETINFPDDAAFKEWRQQYERERMVSFIYRGGTKKISKECSVAYMVCHRSGHYKPTVGDTSRRQRRMKPQGSCKIGGYCTAGIKLLKSLTSGEIKMEICHTHYGHPLDSEAIPHLRVNPALRKIILKKFEEGMSYADMLAYIHHNPDGLEGLRLVDRRAVRNIYDAWKKPVSKHKSSEIEQNSSSLETSTSGSSACHGTDGLTNAPCVDVDFVQHEPNEMEVDNFEELGDSNSPPMLISIDSVTSLNPDLKPKKCKVDNESTVEVDKGKVRRKGGKKIEVPLRHSSSFSKECRTIPSSSKVSYHLRPNRKVEVYRNARSKSVSAPKADAKAQEHDDQRSSKIVPREPFNFTKAQDLPSVSADMEATIDRLHNHGESGPTILLYKKYGENMTKYGGFCRVFTEDEFCLIIQTPVQRQIMQMFPKIIGIEILKSSQSNEHGLKLTYVSVLDDFREPIPVAWMIFDSPVAKVHNQLFRILRYHCGELQVQCIMGPKNDEIMKSWNSHFSNKPKLILNNFWVRRELRSLLARYFPNDSTRKNAWSILEKIFVEKDVDLVKTWKERFAVVVKDNPNGSTFLRKMEKEWFSKVDQWSFAYRVGSSPNLLFVENGFFKLKKFVSFKGTKGLNQSIDQILKIGYDKCFLRTKRMFKGDQKFSDLLEKLEKLHSSAVNKLNHAFIEEKMDGRLWKLDIDCDSFEIIHLQSPCECKVICKSCKVCMHEYVCTCEDFRKDQIMCVHIHKVHCFHNNIPFEESDKPVTKLNVGKSFDNGDVVHDSTPTEIHIEIQPSNGNSETFNFSDDLQQRVRSNSLLDHEDGESINQNIGKIAIVLDAGTDMQNRLAPLIQHL